MSTTEQTERLKKLSPAKRALLMRSLQKNATQGQETQSIPRRERQRDIPLSFAQQRLWLIDKLETDAVAYNVPFAVRLKGQLDAAALERSINEIIKRHEVLRTTFTLDGDHPIQIIAPTASLTVSLLSLKDFPADKREAEVQRLAAEEARRPFDLLNGPLLRATLLQLDEQEHVALFTMHHIVSDGWSDTVLIQEMISFYAADLAGQPATLPELPIQYADFALWQRERLQGAVLDDLLSYWKQQLAGAPPLLNLPTDYPRPPVQTHPGAIQSKVFSERIYEGLRNLSRQEGVTLFVTALAAFKTLLYKYTNQTDMVIGTPVANRAQIETEGLIGCFLNTLVLRTNLSGNPSFRQLLSQVQATTLGAQAHQDLPFELLIETLKLERNLSYAPLFQVLFLYQNKPVGKLEQAGLSLTPIDVHSGTAKFDLNLSVVEGTDGQLTASLEYNTDLFTETTVARLLGHFETLLESIIADPDQRLLDLPWLDAAQQHQLLSTWNETQLELDQTRCLHHHIEQQAARTPEAVALVFNKESLTYQQLNERANRLAHRLISLGVGPETLVAILMQRSTEMVISLLAVLKAGAAYLPLDPTYPPQRLAFMLEDAQPLVLIQQAGVKRPVSVPEGIAVVELDEQTNAATTNSDLTQDSSANPDVALSPDNIAYLIYTSGSTGQPKGVMVSHRAIANRLLWMQHQYQLDSSDAVLQKTPFTFDVSLWEFFWPLMTGARLVLARPHGHQDSRYLRDIITAEQITTLHFVPSMLQAFIAEEGLEAGCRSLRRVICSGEALPVELVERSFERLSAEIENLYGPTEAAVDVTRWGCERGVKETSIPIGRPIANMQMYVLDERLKPVPVGVSGELYIGGVGLARGYRGRAELTAERFVPNPYSTEAGERLYRTGDIGKYRADGALEYVGRVDYQVKVRGYRIELGEIEAVLRQHQSVADSVVVARQSASGQKQLVGYVVIEKGAGATAEQVTSADLRKYVGERLPQYMVPAILVKLDEMPLSENGKINRQRLPEPESRQAEIKYAAPTNPVEESLTAIWVQVLRIDTVSIDDNFFALGGDSIRIVQIVSQAQQKGLNLEAQMIYQHQTIRELALELEKAAQQAGTAGAQPGGEEDAETLARLMEMLEGLSEDDVKERIEEKTGAPLVRDIL